MSQTPISTLNFIQEDHGRFVATVVAECLAVTSLVDPVAWSRELSAICRFANKHLGINPHGVIDNLLWEKNELRWSPVELRDAAQEWLNGRRHS